ncbi:MAG TPA: ATP-binding protein [Pseudomonadales bacterium]
MSYTPETAGAAERGVAPGQPVRDIATLTELSAQWLALDSRQLVEHLADHLRAMLDLDFISLSVTGLAMHDDVRVVRTKPRAAPSVDAETIMKATEATRGADGVAWLTEASRAMQTPLAALTVKLDSLETRLMAGKREAGFPDDATYTLLRTALNLAAPHLRRIDAESQLRRQAAESNLIPAVIRERDANSRGHARDAFLMQLDSALRPLTDPNEMALAAATLVGRYLDVDRCAYADIEDDQDTMNLAGNYLRGPEIRSIVGTLHFHDFGAEVLQLMRDGQAFVVDDIDTHQPALANKAAYNATQIQAVICVPLHKNGRFVAAMAVHQRAPRTWTQDEVELVTSVASRCWESIERSRLERELGKKYASLFMQTPIAICVLEGPSYIYRLANPSYLALVSAKSEDLLDRPLFDALPELKGQGREPLLNAVYASGKPYFGKEIPLLLKRGDGLESRYIDFIYQPRFDSKGAVDGIMVIATDVSEKVEARLQLERAVQELRATTDENKRLFDEMRNTDRRKDEFLATLAHELRNPLAPIKNSLEILRNTEDRTRIARLRDIMDSQLTHLIRLVDDLLDMARINEGKIELRKERITLQSAIEATIESNRWQIEAQRHEFDIRVPQEPVWVAADPTRLTQVISNLLSNAAKYTPPGGRIELTAACEGAMAVVTVTDNGIGIRPEMTERIFEPFMQGEEGKQHARGGMGIGLSLVKRLIEMHGGFVTVNSAGTDRGSSFTVGLPLAEEAARAATSIHSTSPRPGSAGNLRVLVVDDNVDSARTLGWMLETKDYHPMLAYSGKEALALAHEHHPNVILLDLGLPDISGYEVCRELRKEPAFKDTLIVAQTGWGQKQDRDKSQEAGFDQHLVKPVHIDDVAALLAAYGRNRPS